MPAPRAGTFGRALRCLAGNDLNVETPWRFLGTGLGGRACTRRRSARGRPVNRWGRFAVAALLAVGLPLALVLAACAAGVSIDASRWRHLAAQQASAALGRAVVLNGALHLTLGRELTLRVGDFQVLNPAGFSAPQLLSVGEVRVRLDLMDLLRGSLRLRRVEADDVRLWLERADDGRANWTSGAPREPDAMRPAIDIGQIELKRVAVHHHDVRTAARRDLDLEALWVNLARDGSLHVALRGQLDARPAYQLELSGGPLRLLQEPAEPWPFKLELKTRGARVKAHGELDARLDKARFDFDATVDDTALAGRWLGLALPQAGMLSLRGRAVAGADAVDITRLEGTLPGTDFTGQLALGFGGARAQLRGAVRFGQLDLSPWRVGQTEREGSAWQALALRDLLALDAELELSVERCFGLPVDVRDASLALHADARGLQAPVRAMLAGARVSGRIALDAAAPTPALALQLDASELALGDLARNLWHVQGVEATLGHAELRVAGRGATLGAWLQDLDASLTMADVKANFRSGPTDRSMAFTLDNLKLLARRGERLRGSARASLMGERIAVSMRGGPLADMLRGPALPVEVEMAAAPATLRIATDLARLRAEHDPALSFAFEARRSGDLARWLGVAPESTLPVAARGRMRLSGQAWQIDATTLRLGRSDLAIQASGSTAANGSPTNARVRSARLDVPELMSLRSGVAPATPGKRGAVPPAAVPRALADADLALDLQQVVLERSTLQDVGLVMRIRQGRLLPSPLKLQVAGMPFEGELEADLRDELPSARLDLSTRQVDVGLLLRTLGVAEGIVDGHADALQFSLRGQGRDWREFVESAAARAQLVGGNIAVRAPLQQALAQIRLHEATIAVAPAEAIRLRLEGTLDRTPLHLELSTASLPALLRDTEHLPFALAARAAGTQLNLDGEVALPLGHAARLRLRMSGDRLDSLGELSRAELPPWGPWSIDGPIHMTPAGYEVQGLQLRVGQSRLDGSARLDLSGPRPHLALQVSAPSLQLDDFPLPKQLVDAPEPPGPSGGLRGTATELAGRTDRLLSARFLRRIDADIDVKAKQVLAGSDRLADGTLHLTLREGRLDLDPAVLNLPGGSMRLAVSYDLKQSELDFAMAANVERFDYGIIARRMGRGEGVRGLFSMNVMLKGRAPSLDRIMRNANGRMDIAVWPTDLRAGVFNFWSVNLVLTLLPMFDPRAPSEVNCMIGRFDLKDGIFSDDKMIIDTTGLRIRGAGQANLASEELSFVFRPRSKGFAVFRPQNPVRVTGTLSDQRIGLDRRDTVESTLRLIASPILWPIEQFTLGRLPRDGADICTNPLRAAEAR